MKIELDIKGREEMERALLQLGPKATAAMGSALWAEGVRVMNAAKELTPVQTGALKTSGLVKLPEITNDGVSVTLGFGGSASDYAEVQHEESSYYHKPPTQYKFLEQPLTDAAQDMGFRLAEELWKKMK